MKSGNFVSNATKISLSWHFFNKAGNIVLSLAALRGLQR